MTSRPHLYVPLVDEAGDLLRYARVRLYLDDGVTPYTGQIFRDRSSTRTYSNPYVASPALVDVYLPNAVRLVLGVTADQSKPEVLSEVYDVSFSGAEAAATVYPMYITGVPPLSALLSATDANDGFWHPLRVDHEHEGVAPDAVVAGKIPRLLRQAGDYLGATALGAQSGGEFARSTLRSAAMLGLGTDANGRGTVAAGRAAYAAEAAVAPWHGGALALGRDSSAGTEGVALGANADASVATGSGVSLLGQQLSIGRDSLGSGPGSVSIGPASRAAQNGVALGARTGSTANGQPGSIGLGAGAQYGLPGDADTTHSAVMIGAYDPTVRTSFSWANPDDSQSESPLDEYKPQMQFAARTVQLQRHLQWLLNPVALQVGGDAVLGSRSGLLGFHGSTPVAKATIGDDEPGSGLSALDNLVYVLRDLGLIGYRTEPMVTYRASDMRTAYRSGDLVPRWNEHFGTEVAASVGGAHPRFTVDNTAFNDHASVDFDNGVYRKSTKPVQELRGPNLLGTAKHYAVVANHVGPAFGLNEGLFNLVGGAQAANDDSVLMSDTVGSTTWQLPNVNRYLMDGLDQTANRQAGLPNPHVYRVSNQVTWPHSQAIIGGPRDQSPRNWDGWSGSIAEIVGMDDTWSENQVRSMTNGLMFKHGIAQSPDAMRTPAQNFVVKQHDPASGPMIFWQQDYSDSYLGKVYGSCVNVPKLIYYVPFISIYLYFDFFYFRGGLLGNWGNISIAIDYEVEVSVYIGDFDGDGDFDARVDVDIEFNEEIEISMGRFALNNNLTWSMGQIGCRTGHKICRVRNKHTREIICISSCPPHRYSDVEVRIYSTNSFGALVLEGTSTLWGDGTFVAKVTHTGHKVARIYEISTGQILGSTEWQERALPRTTVYATDDSDVSTAAKDTASSYTAALSALVFTEMDQAYRYRARTVLSSLAAVVNDDGSLNDTYSASAPVKTARAGGALPSVRGATWAIMAVLRYWGVTGDGQHLPFAQKLANYLLTLQATSGAAQGSILTGPGQTAANTADNALTYFALRDLAVATGTTGYATAAQLVRTSLLANHWVAATQRFGQGAGDDKEALEADVYGGLFLNAIGDRVKARATIRHLRRFRVKNASVSAPHYAGPSALIGYKPFAELGSSPYVSPPAIIDQATSWLAVLFKMRYGEPVGDDVASLLRWQATSITGPNSSGLYGAQFLSYSASASGAPWGIRTRPNVGAAAWGFLMTRSARSLLAVDPLPAPVPTGLVVTATYDASAFRVVFRYAWAADPLVPVAAFEAVPEFSINAGSSWSPVSSNTITGSVEPIRDAAVGTNGFSSTWSVPVPSNNSTVYRVRLRLRNATFGPWITSGQVSLPAIT